jgi:DNA-binding CsgD family transcriptional regulator
MAVLRALADGDHRAAMALLAGSEGGDPRWHVAAALAHRHAGRLKEAREELARAMLVLDGSECAARAWAVLAAADLDVLQGRADDAAATLARLPQPLPPEWGQWAAALRARAGLALDPSADPGEAPTAFTAPAGGTLGRLRAAVAEGLRTGRSEPFATAIDAADAHQLPIEGAEARMWAASVPGADPRLAELAVATLQRCGSRGWEARLRLPTPVPAAVQVSDPALDALSQAERRVAEAVARGLTNREVADHLYLSVKTVDFHLQQMYRKLGIRSRTELAVRMAGYVPPTTGDRG